MTRGIQASADAVAVDHTTIQCEGCDRSFVIDGTLRAHASMDVLFGAYGPANALLEIEVKSDLARQVEVLSKTIVELHNRHVKDKKLPTVEFKGASGVEIHVDPFLARIPPTPCPNCGYLQSYMAHTVMIPRQGCSAGLQAAFALGILGLCPLVFFGTQVVDGDRITGFSLTVPFLVTFSVYVTVLVLLRVWERRKKVAELAVEKSRVHPNAAWLEQHDLTLETVPQYRPPSDWKCDPEVTVTYTRS